MALVSDCCAAAPPGRPHRSLADPNQRRSAARAGQSLRQHIHGKRRPRFWARSAGGAQLGWARHRVATGRAPRDRAARPVLLPRVRAARCHTARQRRAAEPWPRQRVAPPPVRTEPGHHGPAARQGKGRLGSWSPGAPVRTRGGPAGRGSGPQTPGRLGGTPGGRRRRTAWGAAAHCWFVRAATRFGARARRAGSRLTCRLRSASCSHARGRGPAQTRGGSRPVRVAAAFCLAAGLAHPQQAGRARLRTRPRPCARNQHANRPSRQV
jgi:hypothetical protein